MKRTLVLRRGRPVLAWLFRPVAGALSGTVTAALSRQRGTVVRFVVLLALACVRCVDRGLQLLLPATGQG